MTTVELHNQKGVIGIFSLDGDKVVADTAAAQEILDQNVVIEPVTLVKLTPDKGDRYLRALPGNLAGTYVWAELKEV